MSDHDKCPVCGSKVIINRYRHYLCTAEGCGFTCSDDAWTHIDKFRTDNKKLRELLERCLIMERTDYYFPAFIADIHATLDKVEKGNDAKYPQMDNLYKLSQCFLERTKRYSESLSIGNFASALDLDFLRKQSHATLYKAWSSLSNDDRELISTLINIKHVPNLEEIYIHDLANAIVKHYCDCNQRKAEGGGE